MWYYSDTTQKTSIYGNDLTPTGRLGTTRASLRGRVGHFAQWPGGHSATRVSGHAETRTSDGTATANANVGAGDSAASQSRASPAPWLNPGRTFRAQPFDSDSYMRQRNTF